MAHTPVHPGTILADKLNAINMSAVTLAKGLQVPLEQVNQLLAGQRDITLPLAIRLGTFFRTDVNFWVQLQNAYDYDKIMCKTRSDTPKRRR